MFPVLDLAGFVGVTSEFQLPLSRDSAVDRLRQQTQICAAPSALGLQGLPRSTDGTDDRRLGHGSLCWELVVIRQ